MKANKPEVCEKCKNRNYCPMDQQERMRFMDGNPVLQDIYLLGLELKLAEEKRRLQNLTLQAHSQLN